MPESLIIGKAFCVYWPHLKPVWPEIRLGVRHPPSGPALFRADPLDPLAPPRLHGRRVRSRTTPLDEVLTRRKIAIDFLLRIRAGVPAGTPIAYVGRSRHQLELSAAAVRNMVKAIGSDSAKDLAQQTDEELMSRYRDDGPEAVFTELVHRYERELYRYLARYLGDPSLADDVFQNTFLQVHLKRGLYENGRPFRPWLYAIATHQAVDCAAESGKTSDAQPGSADVTVPARVGGRIVARPAGQRGDRSARGAAGTGAAAMGPRQHRTPARRTPPDA